MKIILALTWRQRIAKICKKSASIFCTSENVFYSQYGSPNVSLTCQKGPAIDCQKMSHRPQY